MLAYVIIMTLTLAVVTFC